MGIRLDIVVTMDWEGLDLHPGNLEEIQAFKSSSRIPIVHYLSPAYFTSGEIESPQNKIIPAFSAEDEVGLHLHTPKHMVEKAGVRFQRGSGFGNSGEQYLGNWAGQETMLLSYSVPDFCKMIQFSKGLFGNIGLAQPKSFRAGGWMAGPDQLRELEHFGFSYDSSAVPPSFIGQSSWKGENIHRYSQLLWADIDFDSLPYKIAPKLIEIPNNLGAIDYWREKDVHDYVEGILELSNKNSYHCAVVTAHQETASQFLPMLRMFVKSLQKVNSVDVRFVTNEMVRKPILDHVVLEKNEADVVFL